MAARPSADKFDLRNPSGIAAMALSLSAATINLACRGFRPSRLSEDYGYSIPNFFEASRGFERIAGDLCALLPNLRDEHFYRLSQIGSVDAIAGDFVVCEPEDFELEFRLLEQVNKACADTLKNQAPTFKLSDFQFSPAELYHFPQILIHSIDDPKAEIAETMVCELIEELAGLCRTRLDLLLCLHPPFEHKLNFFPRNPAELASSKLIHQQFSPPKKRGRPSGSSSDDDFEQVVEIALDLFCENRSAAKPYVAAKRAYRLALDEGLQVSTSADTNSNQDTSSKVTKDADGKKLLDAPIRRIVKGMRQFVTNEGFKTLEGYWRVNDPEDDLIGSDDEFLWIVPPVMQDDRDPNPSD